MAGFKDFADGNYFTGDEVDGYLMRQTAMRFTTAANLTSQLGAGVREVGMIAWADDLQAYYLWDGTNWIPWMSPEKTSSVGFTAGGTNITFGNAVVSQKWRYSGGMVKWNYQFTQGSTSNMQSGNYALALPVAVHADQQYGVLGQVTFYDSSAAVMYTRVAVNLGNTTNMGIVSEAGVRMSPVNPITTGVGDVISISLLYRPAVGLFL
jgi:hypothetical protein